MTKVRLISERKWWIGEYEGQCLEQGCPPCAKLAAILFARRRSPLRAARLTLELQDMPEQHWKEAIAGLEASWGRQGDEPAESPLTQARRLNADVDLRDSDAA